MGNLTLFYPGGPNVTAKVLIRERGRQERDNQRVGCGCDNGSGGWSDTRKEP